MRKSFSIIESLIFLIVMSFLARTLIQVSQTYTRQSYEVSSDIELYTTWQNFLSYVENNPDKACPTQQFQSSFFEDKNISVTTSCDVVDSQLMLYKLKVQLTRGSVSEGDLVRYDKTIFLSY